MWVFFLFCNDSTYQTDLLIFNVTIISNGLGFTLGQEYVKVLVLATTLQDLSFTVRVVISSGP